MSGAPRVCSCAQCGAPMAFRTPFCAYCRAPATWSDVPALRPGAVLEAYDMTRAPLPQEHANRTARRGDGALVSLPRDALVGGLCRGPLRNGCVAATGVCLDEHGRLGVMARTINLPSVQVGYRAVVLPASRSFLLERFVAGAAESHSDRLCAAEAVVHVQPPGQPNRVELRCADSIVHLVINGSTVATVIDARLGFGWPGWIAASEATGAAQVLVQHLEVRLIELPLRHIVPSGATIALYAAAILLGVLAPLGLVAAVITAIRGVAAGTCPACGEEILPIPAGAAQLTCASCQRRLEVADGALAEMDAPPPPAAADDA